MGVVSMSSKQLQQRLHSGMQLPISESIFSFDQAARMPSLCSCSYVGAGRTGRLDGLGLSELQVRDPTIRARFPPDCRIESILRDWVLPLAS